MSSSPDQAGPGSVDVRRLRYFVAVAEELHFTRAAQRLGITQSSLSAAVQRLEEERDVVLLRRSTRRVELTEDGARLLEEARRLLSAVDRFTSPPPVTQLRVGAAPPGRMGLLDPIVAEWARGEPAEVISLREEFSGALVRSMDEGALDISITMATPAEGPGRTVELLARIPLAAALAPGHPLASNGPVRLAELAGMALQTFGDDDTAGPRAVAIEACRAAGFEPRIAAVPYVYSTPELVDGNAFALVPALPWSFSTGLALVPLAEPAPTISFDLAWRDHGGEPVESFVAASRRVRDARGWLGGRRGSTARGGP